MPFNYFWVQVIQSPRDVISIKRNNDAAAKGFKSKPDQRVLQNLYSDDKGKNSWERIDWQRAGKSGMTILGKIKMRQLFQQIILFWKLLGVQQVKI